MKLDDIDQKLLEMLVADARSSMKTLAAGAGLSSPSTAERIRRLEERGLVLGYTADLAPKALGFAIEALIRVRPLPSRAGAVEDRIRRLPGAVECDKVTGDDCYVVRLFATSIEDLDAATEILSEEATINTSIVKRQLFPRRVPGLPV